MILQPIEPIDDLPGSHAHRDLVPRREKGYSMYSLLRLFGDMGDQPDWRPRWQLCHAYYDDKQLTEDQRRLALKEGLQPRSTNLIRPIVNSVLGQEAKSRTDVRLEADDDEYQPVVDALSPKLKEAERESLAHLAIGSAYADMVKGGLGCVHVTRRTDPRLYPYCVEQVPVDEVWWDWTGQRGITTEHARWLVRRRLVDIDEVIAKYPKHEQYIKWCTGGMNERFIEDQFIGEPGSNMLNTPGGFSMDSYRLWNQSARHQWLDTARKMVMMYEVWYRVPAYVVMMALPGGRRIPLNERDPRHMAALQKGVKLEREVTMQVRKALFAGPYRLYDIGTERKTFPYILFFAYRDSEDKSPYGLIEGMISPQDEYNERRLRIQWMLKARQVQMDSDAVATKYNSIKDVTNGIHRPDFVVITNPDRTNKNSEAVKVANALNLQPEQFNVLADAERLIQATAGRYSSSLGSSPQGVTSGIANSILVEQGEQSMGELNDSHSFSRRAVFEELVSLIAEDHKADGMQVKVGTGSARRTIVLNEWDPQTGAGINRVEDANVRAGLAEVPASPAFRQQEQQQLANIISALGGNQAAVTVLAPHFIEGSSLPNRKQASDDLRRATGQPLAEDREGQEAAQLEQQQAQKQAQQLAAQEAQARVAELQAKAQKAAADAQKAAAEARRAEAEATEFEARVRAGAPIAESAAVVARDMSTAALNEAKALQARRQDNDPDPVADALREASET